MANKLCEQLIEFGSMFLDMELELSCPSLIPAATHTSFRSEEYEFEQPSHEESFFKEDLKELEETKIELTPKTPQEIENSYLSVPRGRKSKKICKNYSYETASREQELSNTKKRRARKSKELKGSQYPTKNFLPNFKGPHIEFLEKYLCIDINQFEIIRYLRNKDGISLKDYEQLYRTEEFEQAFEAMFQSNFLYRQLLLSRSDLETKKIHQKKLYVFEQAYRTKTFTKIN